MKSPIPSIQTQRIFLARLSPIVKLPQFGKTRCKRMKAIHLALLAALTFPLSGNGQGLPPAIQEARRASDRYALNDFNGDGWDDLWLAIFPRIDSTKPNEDSDGDGESNFEEMLGFKDPYDGQKGVRQLSDAEIKEKRKQAIIDRRAANFRKMERFQSLLESRGAVLPAVPGKNAPEKAQDPAPPVTEPEKETSSVDAANLYFLLSNPQLLLSDPVITAPQVLGMEKLSNGQVLVAWEGRPDRLHEIESSNDLVNWESEVSDLPNVNGLGLWGQTTSAPKRFYRVVDSGFATRPSAADGGDGVSTFGGTIDVTYNSTARQADVTVNTPGAVPSGKLALYIDGERYDGEFFVTTGGVYRCLLPRESLLPGTHTVYAVIDAYSETTPTGGESPAQSAGIFRTQAQSFVATQDYPGLALGFRSTEKDINASDPSLLGMTVFEAEIPEGFTSWSLKLKDSDGNLAREWNGTIDPGSPESLSVPWDGRDTSGSYLPSDTYSAELSMGGPSDYDGGSVLINAGVPTWKALCAAEPLINVLSPTWDFSIFRPSWANLFPGTSGRGWDPIANDYPAGTDVGNAWGPWDILKSCKTIPEGLRESLGASGKWGVKRWVNGVPNKDSAPNVLAGFEGGGNPFNDFDLGVFIGHGVSNSGGTAGGTTLPPQHYMPLVKNQTTGEAYWVKSGQIPKYGATGNLKWMFMMTCSFFYENAHYSIFNEMLTAGNFPMGEKLHVLSGYSSKIDLEGQMGALLAKGLKQDPVGVTTITDAWDYVYQKSLNAMDHDYDGNPKLVRHARCVFWPECKNDTIIGAKRSESITTPVAPFNFSRLEKREIPTP